MSLKENIGFVKEELNSEEKFLENFVKAERFFKKFKKVIIGSAAVIVIAVIGITVSNYMQAQNKLAANKAFNKLLEDPNNAEALAVLKTKNPKLAQIANYLNGKEANIDIAYVKELNEYQKAIENKDIAKISQISMQSDFLIKEYALFNKALLLAQESKYKEAKETLKLIPMESKAGNLVKALEHYLITK